MADPPPPPPPRRLESWKEIASFFNVSTRTVQKCETERGWPVQRLPGLKGRVFALQNELEAWSARALPADPPPEPAQLPAPRWKPWAWTAGLALLVSLILLVSWKHRQAPLASHRLEGQILVALDAAGQEAWRYDLGRPVSVESRTEDLGDAAKPWFGDLDGDGSNEMLFIQFQPLRQSGVDRLLCYSRSGKLEWSFAAGRKVASGKEQFDPPFHLTGFRLVKLGPGKGLAVLALAVHSLYYPTQAALLSPHGKLLREYWHSGQVFRSAVGDLDADGRDEIYLGGVSNGYKSATLVVLDPLTTGGASREENSDYQLEGFDPPHEVARVLLPVSRPARGISPYNVVEHVRLTQSEIALEVLEDPVLGPSASLATYFHFSPRLELLRAGAAGSYEHALRLAGRPGEHLTAQDLEDLKHVRYLTTPPAGLAWARP